MKKETASQRARRDSQTSHCSASSCCWMNYGTCLGSAWKSWRSPMTSMPYSVCEVLLKKFISFCYMWFMFVQAAWFCELLPQCFPCFPSSTACRGGLLPSPCHRAREQTSCEGHPREPAFSHQRWASTTVASTPYTCHTFIPRPVLFQGTIFHAHLFKPATRHPEVPPLCRWAWKI